MINVVLTHNADTEQFANLLNQHGYSYKQFKAVKRMFTVYVDQSDFALKGHLDIESLVVGEGANLSPAYSHINQTVNINADTQAIQGAWALPRMIRRKSPYVTGKPMTSTSLSFKCNRSGEGVDIYVVDSGVDLSHPEFEGRAFDVRGTGVYGNFHGTGVASNAAGKNYGVAKKALIFSAVSSLSISLSDFQVATAIDDCLTHYLSRSATNRPAVMNLSFGGIDGTPLTSAAIEECIDSGMVVCIAAANARIDTDVIPFTPTSGCSTDVITIGGTNINDNPYYESPFFGTNWGDRVDIYGPAQEILLAYPTDQAPDRTDSGTSFSCPFAAGIIALMLQGYQRPTTRLQVRAVKNRLIDNSTKNAIVSPSNYLSALGNIPAITPRVQMSIEHNRLLYIDPFKTIEGIPELTPL